MLLLEKRLSIQNISKSMAVFSKQGPRSNFEIGGHTSDSILTLTLAGYFAKHIQARGGGGSLTPHKNFETANN